MPDARAATPAAAPAPAPTRLADYAPPPFLIDETRLAFDLAPRGTRVRARIAFRPNPDAAPTRTLSLDGEALRTLRVAVDGAEIPHEAEGTTLRVPVPAAPFVLETEVEIDPADNTELSGLYLSNGMYCTQCEAQGFRRITWYPDRPDVMAPFHVTIRSPLPVLLSNGDPLSHAGGAAEWSDPHPKPSYLFALVAGDLRAHRATFATMGGREVALAIWTRPGPDEGRCAFAMDALIRSMAWDERAYGREYDLDVFNIVAVDDFNMGAMENKGLNVFNSAVVLASPETATDDAFARIEAIVAHEYFHNWTGNRITCRDWFQLCLKEGLTVYRDQGFSEDERGAGPERIAQVRTLRARQFREDAGPLAHPVRPESYVAIDNFYTATVYEKGAELVRMLRLLVGEDAWAGGLERYWTRHDGQAVTIEDWLACFADASGQDLAAFARWYSQAGTPRLEVETAWTPDQDAGAPDPARGGPAADAAPEPRPGTLRLTLRQETPPTPGQPDKAPLPMPVAIGLLAPDGTEALPTTILTLEGAEASFELPAPEGAVPSLLRGASAPVIVRREVPDAELAFLLAHDTDPVARWDAGQRLARAVLMRAVRGEGAPDGAWMDAVRAAATDRGQDPRVRALALALPGVEELAQALLEAGDVPDPGAIHAARERAADTLAAHLAADLPAIRAACATPGPYDPGPGPAGRRALGLAALELLTRLDGGAAARAARDAATNLTEELGALGCLLTAGDPRAAAAFRARWAGERLVLDRWFAAQVARARPAEAAATALRLTGDPLYDAANPNRFRAVWGALAGNSAGFHHPSGAGYAALADALIALAPRNPQAAARLTGAFETWRRHGPALAALARAALERIAAAPDLPPDVEEMAQRLLGDA